MKEWHRELAHLKAFTPLTVTELARKLGKARNTVHKALQMQDVSALIEQLRSGREQEIAQTGTELVTRMIDKSWEALEEVLDSEGASPQKVTAALGILKGTGQLVERTEQDVRQVIGVIPIPARVAAEEWQEYLEQKRKELSSPSEAPNGVET